MGVDTPQLPAIREGFQATVQRLSHQLMPRSRRVYRGDIQAFVAWLADHDLTPATADGDAVAAYRAHLAATYAKATAARMFSICRSFLRTAHQRGQIATNPAEGIKGFKLANETTHTVLTHDQARQLLDAIDTRTTQGKRDHALIRLLLQTGIRREECAALRLSDFRQQLGHTVLDIQHGKGDDHRVVKVPVVVMRAIQDYLAALPPRPIDAPLFISLRKHRGSPLSASTIEYLIKGYALRAFGHTIHLSPHGLRATFITLALESGAPIHKVQYAAGHKDPRTTERYHKRKLDLDDNAVDYIRL